MKTQFTPGPWKVGTHDRVINRYPIYARIGPVQLARIAVTDGHDVGFGISQAEMTANAALIAAAPELLEAAKYVVRWHREHDSGEGELYGLDYVTTCIAAIRKAEGVQDA